MSHRRNGGTVDTTVDPRADLNAVQREVQAFHLRMQGYAFDEIGQMCGITKQGAHSAYKRALARIPKREIEEMRETIYAQQMHALKSLSTKIAKGDTFAIREMTAIHERMAKLFGLDVPTDTPQQAQMMIVAVPQPVMEAI